MCAIYWTETKRDCKTTLYMFICLYVISLSLSLSLSLYVTFEYFGLTVSIMEAPLRTVLLCNIEHI